MFMRDTFQEGRSIMHADKLKLPTVALGSVVHIRDVESNDRDTYILTRPGDADIRRRRISSSSPIGRAIYGSRPGDIVEVDAPGGFFLVEVEDVEDAPPLSWDQEGIVGLPVIKIDETRALHQTSTLSRT
jgi:hypothetical protein